MTIWNNYLLPLVMLNDPQRFPVTLGLTLWYSQTQRDPLFTQLVVTGSAVSVVLLVALMVVAAALLEGRPHGWRDEGLIGADGGG